MLNKRHNPVATFFILLTLVGVSKPAKALLVDQNDKVTTFIFEATNNTERDINVSLNSVADTDIEKSESLADVDEKLHANLNTDDSGSINPDIEDSGSVDLNLEDSGKINFDVEGSGDIDSGVDLEDSGSINPDIEDSGSIAPDLEDSGKQYPALKGSSLPSLHQSISLRSDNSITIADADNNLVAQNEVEEDEIATDRRGAWWWWLPLVIGIPIIAAIVISTLGRNRSDRQPAIDRVGDLNNTGGIGVADTSDREISAVGANVGNVELDNAVSTSATSIGASTLAEDTTTNFVDDRSRIENNVVEDTNSITEIPSTSVSEFTGYETKLQTGESSTRLQDDDIDLDSINNIPPINPIDNVAASELVADVDLEETTTESEVEVSEAVTETKIDTNTVEPLSNLSIDRSDLHDEDTSNNIVEGNTAIEDAEIKEFRGDFVLQEETEGFTPYQENDADLDLRETARSSDLLDDGTELVELNVSQPDVTISEVDSDIDLVESAQPDTVETTTSQDIEVIELDSDRTPSSDEEASWVANSELVEEQNNATINDLLDDGTELAQLNVSQPDVATSEVDSDIDLTESAQPDTVETTTSQEDIEVIGFDSDRYLEPTQTDLDLDEPDRANESQRLDDRDRVLSEETSDRDLTDNFEVVNISIDEIGFDDGDETIEEISLDNSELDEAGFDEDSTQTTVVSLNEISFGEANETSLDEISLDDESTQTIDASLDEISSDNLELDEISLDNLELDEINLDDSELNEISLEDESTQAIDASLNEISFNEADETSLDEISFDDSELNEISLDEDSTQTIDASLDEISFDEANETSLDQISFNDSELNEISLEDESTQTIDASLNEISFDDSELDEISFDDSELDEIVFDDESTQTTDASLDEISFDDSELDEIVFDDESTQTTDASLDEISFDDSELDAFVFDDESTQTTDASLDEISFDDSELDETIDASLDEISFDDSENASSNMVDNFDSDEVSYEELDKASGNSTSDLLSNSTAGITSLSNDEVEDMDNITEWLESLETPKQSTDNILEWLDGLNTEDTDSMPENSDRQVESEGSDDISFQFIEDLLEDDPNRENK